MRTKTALVTGSTGFVGRHMVARLKEDDYDVDPWDITQGNDCLRLFADRSSPRYDLVVHAAATGPNRLAIDDEPEHFPYNVQLDSAMFNWVRRTEPRHVVYLSSSAAYPMSMQGRRAINPQQRPLEEDDVNLKYTGPPADDYGWTKLLGEMLAAKVRSTGRTAVTVVRPFSGYGEDQGEEFPFGAIVERVRRREDPVTFLGNGQQVRDWVHVDDVVATVMALTREPHSTTVNVCTGVGTTIKQLAYMATQIAGYKPQLQAATDSWGGSHAGVDYRVGDPTKMFKYHYPRVNLAQGIARRLEAY